MKYGLLSILLLMACGGPAAPGGPNPDPTSSTNPCGAHGLLQNNACFCGAGYTGAHCEQAPTKPAPETPCTPGAYLCDGAEIRQCTTAGKVSSATLIKDCGVETALTACGACGATGAPACQSPQPYCAGTLSGVIASPMAFSDSGCSPGISCALALYAHTADSGQGLRFNGTLNGLMVTWAVTDITKVPSGAELPLVEGGTQNPYGFVMSLIERGSLSASNTAGSSPPRTGSFTVTYDAFAPGEVITLDVNGPLYDQQKSAWVETLFHMQAIIH